MNKSKTITIGLLIMTVILMVSIFYIGYMLTNTSDKITTVSPRTTKAQNVAYNKFIAFNTTGTETPTLTQTSITVSPTQTSANQLLAQNVSPSPSLTVPSVTPILTEINLANTSPTASASAVPVSKLPQTGYLTNVIIMFGVAGLMIFFSFLY